MAILRFSEIMTAGMNEEGIGIVELGKRIKDAGVWDADFRRLSEYVNGKVTPPFWKARAIINGLGMTMTEEQLLESVKKQKEYIKENRIEEELREYNRSANVYVKFRHLIPGKDSQFVEKEIQRHITELYGNEAKLSKYIEDLIAYDLKNDILRKENEA